MSLEDVPKEVAAEPDVGVGEQRQRRWLGRQEEQWLAEPGVCSEQTEEVERLAGSEGQGPASPPKQVVNGEPRRVSDRNPISRIQGPSFISLQDRAVGSSLFQLQAGNQTPWAQNWPGITIYLPPQAARDAAG